MDFINERVGIASLKQRVIDPETAVDRFFNGVKSAAFGGMGGQSVPKAIPKTLKEFSSKLELNDLTIYTGGGGTPSFEDSISSLDIRRRYYYLSGDNFRNKVNSGEVEFFDYWVSEYSRNLRTGFFNGSNKIDVAVIEISRIDNDGRLIPSLSVDSSIAMIEASEKVILEINSSKPVFEGLHDIYVPKEGGVIPLQRVTERIGRPWIEMPKSKIAAIVFSDEQEEPSGSYGAVGGDSLKVGSLVAEFLRGSILDRSRTRPPPLQLGAGTIANSVLASLDATALKVWSEIIPSGWIDKVGNEVREISASAIYNMTGSGDDLASVYEEIQTKNQQIVLRPNEITNSAEVISRLGVVVVQPALEIDIYGSVNVSHLNGNIRNGVGGSGDFTKAAGLTIIAMPSTASNGKHSRIVPLLSNVDIPRQDVDIVITEQGIADLRGLSPLERSRAIISNCANPTFSQRLWEYVEKVRAKGGHAPVDWHNAIKTMEEM